MSGIRFFLFFLCIFIANSVYADENNESKKHFENGLGLMRMANFNGAATELEQSVALFPTPEVLLNLADCYMALNRYSEALELFERLKSEYKEKLELKYFKKIQKRIDDIQNLIVRLRINVTPKGAIVAIDEKPIGTSPITEQFIFGPGTYKIVVSSDGYKTATRQVSLVSGTEITESFVLEQLLAEVVVRSNMDGSSIWVDGEMLGKTPFSEPLRLTGGAHIIRVAKEGCETQEYDVTLVSGEKTSLIVTLVERLPLPAQIREPQELPTPPVEETKVSEHKKQTGKLSSLFLVGLTVTAVTSIASGVFWALAASEMNDYEDDRKDYERLAENWNPINAEMILSEDRTYKKMKESRDNAETFNGIAIGTTIATGVSLAVTVVGLVVEPKEKEQVDVSFSQGGMLVRF